jgi:hypothetical protein
MKLFSGLSIKRGIGYLLVFILCVNCKKDYNSTDPSQLSPESISQSVVGNTVGSASSLSQTKTANRFNWNGNPYMNLWQTEGAQYVSANDNSFAYSKKLSAGRSFLSLVLQDFRFDLPANATIGSITVLVRRFKKGNGSITDYFAWLYRSGSGFYNPSPYGVRWTDPTNYPNVETEVSYYQGGSGISSFGCQPEPVGCPSYQWTPAMINDADFGVRIDTYAPVGGSLTVYYDLVTITVQYSLPGVVAP